MDITVASVTCPNCGIDDTSGMIRGFKVHTQGVWWSECLNCELHTGCTHTLWFADDEWIWEPGCKWTMAQIEEYHKAHPHHRPLQHPPQTH